mmetsp:Transcript_5511/g.10765  ORF Transcript_5511/g.10765 Transcript_5511/m.10765 type:complete len:281 (+) Transcript_5511:226-1068(+)
MPLRRRFYRPNAFQILHHRMIRPMRLLRPPQRTPAIPRMRPLVLIQPALEQKLDDLHVPSPHRLVQRVPSVVVLMLQSIGVVDRDSDEGLEISRGRGRVCAQALHPFVILAGIEPRLGVRLEPPPLLFRPRYDIMRNPVANIQIFPPRTLLIVLALQLQILPRLLVQILQTLLAVLSIPALLLLPLQRVTQRFEVNEHIGIMPSHQRKRPTVNHRMTLVKHHVPHLHRNIVRVPIVTVHLQRPRFIDVLIDVDDGANDQRSTIDVGSEDGSLGVYPYSVQ